MSFNIEAFNERYNKLNTRQKEAVDTIYGPVMVIAGPGTGKTEVLSMRIAALLNSEAQVQPSEILCLTYTEEATNSMRRRLVQIIGPAAHKVNIFTFHAFCNSIIQNNSEYFSLRTLQPITDLERTDLLYEMLEQLPSGHPLRKLSGNIYYDAGKLNRLFDIMKREYLSAEYISKAIDEYLASLPTREDYIYKRNGKGFAKGDVKQAAIDEETRRMEITRAAASLFDTYEVKMKEQGRYDFNDMILWVLDAFKKHPWMLQSYQERYQFTLVDEFQDTNGAQNELVNILTSYWEDPNIFVVGDDDQSIYEFQGARIRNIIEFYERYKETIKIVILPENYRSSQQVLDRAMATIVNNKQRLINQLSALQLDKNIVSANPRFKDIPDIVHPEVRVYNNILQEEADTVLRIEQLMQQGVALNEVAVLYAQHRQAENIIALLERKNIPYNIRREVNLLDQPFVEQVLRILDYLQQEKKKIFSAEELLFDLMHAPYFEISPTDIAQMALYIQANKKAPGLKWRMVIGNALQLETMELQNPDAIRRLSANLENWERDQAAMPLPLLVEKIIYEGGIVNHILAQTDHVWQLQVLYSFFGFIKDHWDRDNKLKSDLLIQRVQRMRDENITEPVQRVVQNDNGVKFYTAHSSKGNEFEYVFLVGCTKNFWEEKKGGGNNYRMPDTITATEEDKDNTYKTEVARRLFYVALTRAKRHLYLSYSLNDNNGKDLAHSVFIDEISTPEERIRQSVPVTEIAEHLKWAVTPVPEVYIRMANARWIERVLQQFTMSYTALSKYLRCPLAFYYELVLRVPFQKNDALAFGSAVHNAIERFYKDMQRTGEFPAKEELISSFKFWLGTEASCFTAIQYDRRTEQGVTLLSDYYDHYISTFPRNVEIEYKVPRYMLDGVPVTAKIDKIEIEGDKCTVVDYKTGDPDKSATPQTAAPNEKEPNGGDYWRQMVFYKIVLEHYEDRRWSVALGKFDFLQKSKTGDYKQVVVPVFANDETTVMQQLKTSYAAIMNHEFNKGCGKDDCHWCNFARRYNLVRPAEEATIEIDDM